MRLRKDPKTILSLFFFSLLLDSTTTFHSAHVTEDHRNITEILEGEGKIEEIRKVGARVHGLQ